MCIRVSSHTTAPPLSLNQLKEIRTFCLSHPKTWMENDQKTLTERLPLCAPSINQWLLKLQSPGFQGGFQRKAKKDQQAFKACSRFHTVLGKGSHAGDDGKTLSRILLQVMAERTMN